MPTGLRRYYGQGHLHFITFSCFRRLPLLKNSGARDVFVKELAKVREEMGFRLIGYAVMPEHLHLLMNELSCGTPSTVLQKPKLRVARKMRKRRKSKRKGTEKLDYMHANPLTRKLVTHPKDWPWSSWGFYARTGKVLVPMDIEK